MEALRMDRPPNACGLQTPSILMGSADELSLLGLTPKTVGFWIPRHRPPGTITSKLSPLSSSTARFEDEGMYLWLESLEALHRVS